MAIHEPIFIPIFIRVDKQNVPEYKFIETIEIGNRHGHVLHGCNRYFLCVSDDENVSTEHCFVHPLGYSRKTLQEIREFAKKMVERIIGTSTYANVKGFQEYEKLTIVPKIDMTKKWHVRNEGLKLINVNSLQECNLTQHRIAVLKSTGLSNHLLGRILDHGECIYNWALKVDRLDKIPWERIAKKQHKRHYKQKEHYIDAVFTNQYTQKRYSYTTVEDTAGDLRVDREILRQALANKKTQIGNWIITHEPLPVSQVEPDGH